MSSQSHSSTALLWHSSLAAGGFVSQWSLSVVGSWWVPGPSHSCGAPSTWAMPPWCLLAEMRAMPPPVSATCPQGCLWISLQGWGKTQWDPSVQYVLSSTSESQGAPRDRVSETTFFSSPLPLVARLSWHLSQGLVGWSHPQHSAEPAALLGIPRSCCAQHRDPSPRSWGNQGHQ